MKLSSATDVKYVCFIKIYFKADIDLQLLRQSVANLATRHILPFTTCERRVIDEEVERDSRLIYGDSWQGYRRFVRRNSFADVDVRQTGDKRDVSGGRLCRLNSLQTFECKNFSRAARAHRTILLFYKNVLIRTHRAFVYSAYC